ncbi:MAG: arsenate reductase family protein [Lentimicrobium sp.]|uniref:arsenate reductase family protein n=1 Tax=Lentimicrobium sp. TaxID=2034841 RepID=UPI0025DF78FE|nr:arsenate reductase family protein [Lentimicrobium sp.]MCO5257740.1 arsenate reductase family protein [Lentimicrobium sp.]
MITIYHNPKCRKSRAGLEYLKTKGVEFEIREYIREGITVEELRSMIDKLGIKPSELVRTQEDYYKENYKGKTLNDEAWLEALAAYPRLIRRPVIVKDIRAVLADPPERTDKLGI